MANLIEQSSSADRRTELLQKKLEGWTKAQIWEWYGMKYQKSLHSLEKDITAVNRKLSLFVQKKPDEIIEDHLAKYDVIYKTSLEYGQLSAANQALANKEKLLGLHKPENQTFVQNNNFNLEHLTDEQIEKILLENKEQKLIND